ncbi:MAG TPA: hypothetical protein VHX65_01505 [Pirellulales bacterium]|jgi:hypothetical protein|nr:hypothetical protein [Pirellulales bacterium]
MSIINSLNVPFPLTAETATVQAALVEKIEAHNTECDSIAEASAELKDTPDSDWTAAHSKAVAKVRDRKLEALLGELSLRKEMGHFFTRVINVDFHIAKSAAKTAIENAKRKATEYLVAGGWTETRSEIAGNVTLFPIDLHILIRNREVFLATLAEQAMSEIPLMEARQSNAAVIEKAKERFAAVKAKAMNLSV